MAAHKVVHIITRLDHGGSAQNTQLTAIGHDQKRFEPIVITGRAGHWTDQGGDRATEENRGLLEGAGVRFYVIPTLTRDIHPIRDLGAFLHLARILRRERPMIVHTHTSKAGVLGRLAAWMVRIPVLIHTPHGHVFYGHFGPTASWVFLQIERMLAKITTHLIALTEAERDEHLARRIGRVDHFSVVPSGIDLDRFRRVVGVARRRPPGFACPPDAIIVGSVGWLTEVKGHRYLIEALARLKSSHPRLHAVLVGSGRLRDEYILLAKKLGVGEMVHLLGERQDVPDCLAAMDVFVLPSLNEGMGRALIEAMAARRPVIATRVGGVPSIVKDRCTGLLVPPANASALAAAIAELLDRPDWAKELSAAAGESIDERFGIPAMVRKVEAIYQTAWQEKGQG